MKAEHCAARTCERWGTPSLWMAPSFASIRIRALPCPATRCSAIPMPKRGESSRTACGIHSGLRSGRPPTRCGSATSAGTRGRRSTGCRIQLTQLVENFGWPCYEGVGRQSGYDSANRPICETLYGEPDAQSGLTLPYFTYNHGQQVVAGEACPTGSSSISGLAFYPRRPVPDRLQRCAVLRGLLAGLHLGDARRARRDSPIQQTSSRSNQM